MRAPGRFPQRYGGRSTTATAAAASRAVGSASDKAITFVTGRRAVPPRCPISRCSVAGTTARSTRRATGSIDSPTASFASAARTAGFCPRSHLLLKCPAIRSTSCERGTMRRGLSCTRTQRRRGGWGCGLGDRCPAPVGDSGEGVSRRRCFHRLRIIRARTGGSRTGFGHQTISSRATRRRRRRGRRACAGRRAPGRAGAPPDPAARTALPGARPSARSRGRPPS